jgi:Ig-like domain CHU_C associated/PA14 domain
MVAMSSLQMTGSSLTTIIDHTIQAYRQPAKNYLFNFYPEHMLNKFHRYKLSLLLTGLLVLACSSVVRSQSASLYFQFGPEIRNPVNLTAGANGNFYFIKYDDNWQPQIAQLSAQGIVTTLLTGNYQPQNLKSDAAGNLYFIDNYNWPAVIKKMTPAGIVSDVMNDPQYAPQNFAFDSSGILYFADGMNWPFDIKKMDLDGHITVLASGEFYPENMITDTDGNLLFTDTYNWPPETRKVLPDGSISTFLSTDYYAQFMAMGKDSSLYFHDGLNWPPEFRKRTMDGNITTVLSEGIENTNSLVVDASNSIYFINYQNDQYNISILRSVSAPCETPAAPFCNDTVVCNGSDITLTAGGFGVINWYDAAVDGSLLATGNSFTPPLILTNTTFYVESSMCELSSPRTAVLVSVSDVPVAAISGITTGNDYVSLTASGGNTYLWNGGASVTTATNAFTNSGTYNVTVTNESGCADNAFATIVVNKFGLTKYGQLTPDTTIKMDTYGAQGTSTYLNKHGKIASSLPSDGLLNYAIFTNAGGYAYNDDDFINFTLPANQTSSGIADPAVLLDWTEWSTLTNAGIAIPNNGEQFSVVVSGYFIPEETGTYLFTCEGDDAVDLFIDNVHVANHYGAHGTEALGTHTGTISLVQGVKYVFRARMQENGGGEGLRVLWRRPSENAGWQIYSTELTSF